MQDLYESANQRANAAFQSLSESVRPSEAFARFDTRPSGKAAVGRIVDYQGGRPIPGKPANYVFGWGF